MTWTRRVRRIFTMTLFTAIALVLAGQSRADAAAVLLLSTGNAATDTTIKMGLEGLGHQVTIGPQYTAFVGTDLSTSDVVLLVPSHNFGAGDMPAAGQLALTSFISSGKGLVTGEWAVWKRGAQSAFVTLSEAIPVIPTGSFRTVSTVTYGVVTADDVLNAGVDLSFTFMADNISGTETNFVAKEGATIFYDTDNPAGESGVIGWDIDLGRVISFSTVMGPLELGDPNYLQLLSNAVTWTVTPH